MKITGKHVLLGGYILSLIAFIGLLISKLVFKANISVVSLCIIGLIELIILTFICFQKNK